MDQNRLKIFYLKKKVIFPHSTVNLEVESSEILEKISRGDKILAYPIRYIFDVFIYRNRLATLGEILEIKTSGNSTTLQIKGLYRIKLKKINKFRLAYFETLKNNNTDNNKELMEILRRKSQELIFLIDVNESAKLINLLNYLVSLDQLSDFISNYFVLNFPKRYKLYNEIKVVKRSKALIKILDSLLLEIQNKRENF